jgi:hypothetical protein
MAINQTAHSTQHKHFHKATGNQQRSPASTMKITRSTTCIDLGLEKAATCDGCVRRGNQTENEKNRDSISAKYFSDKYNSRSIGKRGKTAGQRLHEGAWTQLAKKGLWCMPTEPAEEEEQPQRRLKKTMEAWTVRTEKETASLSKVTVKQTRQQIIEDFVDSMSCKNDVVMLIDKLLFAIGYKQEDVIDLTNIFDSPPRADPLDTATAVQALCELHCVPKILAETEVPTETGNDRDVSEAARILCDTISQSKKGGNVMPTMYFKL